MATIQVSGVVLPMPFGDVEVSNLLVASNNLSEFEIRKLNVGKIVNQRLYQVADGAQTMPALCNALERGGDVLIGPGIFWLKRQARARPNVF
jgi:hypothetical protein